MNSEDDYSEEENSQQGGNNNGSSGAGILDALGDDDVVVDADVLGDDEDAEEGGGGGKSSSRQAAAITMRQMQQMRAQALLMKSRGKSKSGSSKSRSRSTSAPSSASSRTRPVVKLMVTSVSRSYTEPWRRKPQRESSGTGFLIRWMDYVDAGGDADADAADDNDNRSGAVDVGDSKVDSDAGAGEGGGIEIPSDTGDVRGIAPESTDNKDKEDNPSINSQPPKIPNTIPTPSVRIVTNAHVIRNASTVRARASFGPFVVSCEVEWVSLPLDLALLKISEGDWDDFCKGWNFSSDAAAAAGGASVGAAGTASSSGGSTAAATTANADGTSATAATSAADPSPSAGTSNDNGSPVKQSDTAASQDVTSASSDKSTTVTNTKSLPDTNSAPPSSTSSPTSSQLTSPKQTEPPNNPNKPKQSNPLPKTPNVLPPNIPSLHCLTLSTSLPKLDENVTCVGFPQGGTQISVTRGVVSRIDVDSQYVLRIQIDAAVNSGNSGGPVFDEQGQVVGVATSILRGAGNIGYIVPGKIVALFLQMCRDGMEASVDERYSGLGNLVVREGMMNDSSTSGNNGAGGSSGDGADGGVLDISIGGIGGVGDGTNSGMERHPKHVPGIPSLKIHGAQTLESKALRRSLGLEELDITGGIRIVGVMASTTDDENTKGCIDGIVGVDDDGESRKKPKLETDETKHQDGTTDETPEEEDPNENKIKGNDVLLAINHIPIGMDGTIQLSPTRPDERINFRSIVTSQRVGTKVILDVLRERQRKELEVVLDTCRFLVPKYDDFDAIPLYVVCGGCVFSPLTLPLATQKAGTSKQLKSTFSRYYSDQRSNHDQILVLSKVLADEVNVGYHGWSNLVLKSVNGHEPRNIQELVDVIVRKLNGEMVEFHFQVVGLEAADFVICLNMQEVLQSEQRILHRHMIACWCSTDALSKGLRENIVKLAASDAERNACWNTMRGMRIVAGRGAEEDD